MPPDCLFQWPVTSTSSYCISAWPNPVMLLRHGDWLEPFMENKTCSLLFTALCKGYDLGHPNGGHEQGRLPGLLSQLSPEGYSRCDRHCAQSPLGRKGPISLTLPQHCHRGSHGRNSNRAGTWRRELMRRPRRTAPLGLLRPSSYRIQDHQPRNCSIHNGQGPSPSITN